MRRAFPLAAVLAAGLAGVATSPGRAAGESGFDRIAAWLRGDAGAATATGGSSDAGAGSGAGAAAAGTSGQAGGSGLTAPSSTAAPGRAGAATRPPAVPLDTLGLPTAPADGADDPTMVPARRAAATPGLRGPVDRTTTGTAGPVTATGRLGVAAAPVKPVAPIGPQRQLAADPIAEIDDPDAIPRYRVGTFVLRPQIDAAFGRTSNMAGKAGGAAGTLYRVKPQVAIASDWSRHAFEATLRGGYDGYPSDRQLNAPSYAGDAKLRLDLAEGTTGDLALRFSSERGKATAAENPADTVVPATTRTEGASLGVTRAVGLVGLTLRGDVDRTRYTGGEPVTDTSRDNTRTALALRATLGGAAIVTPYVEVQAIGRRFSDPASRGRDSRGGAAILGARIDLGPVLSGEVAAGWSRETSDDPALGALTGPTFDARLLWSPTRLTDVTFTARTTLDPTTLAGSPGSVDRRAEATLAHRLTRDWTGTLGVSAEARSYEGVSLEERTVGASAEVAWRFDPHLELYARGDWSRFTSSRPGEDYRSVTVMTGLRLR
jgi:hypothetical protein